MNLCLSHGQLAQNEIQTAFSRMELPNFISFDNNHDSKCASFCHRLDLSAQLFTHS